jgi:hypothetical protein
MFFNMYIDLQAEIGEEGSKIVLLVEMYLDQFLEASNREIYNIPDVPLGNGQVEKIPRSM